MTIELAGSILFFILAVVALLFSLTKTSHVTGEDFPNRFRFYAGMASWILAGILAVFVSFPGYSEWFVPAIYPVFKGVLLGVFFVGFFLILTTLTAFPVHMAYFRREIDGRTDRIALLENIRQITAQPYPITELFNLALKELGSHLAVQKGALFLINPSHREMYLAAQIGLDKEELGRLERFPIGQDIISQAATEQQPYISGDLAAADGTSRKLILAGRSAALSAAAIPLTSRDRSLGTLLILSDKPYRFEKRDRMLLSAAAEAIAGVVELGRLSRENQKLSQRAEEQQAQTDFLRDMLNRQAQDPTNEKTLAALCRYLAERYQAPVCRVITVSQGELVTLARFADGDVGRESQSFQVAVIEALRQRKMVVLNQEAKDQNGNTYISRSALLCPLQVKAGEYALLLEAAGNSLPLTNQFLTDLESVMAVAMMSLNSAASENADRLSRSVVTTLLNILKIDYGRSGADTLPSFLRETVNLLGDDATALILAPGKDGGYRVLDGRPRPDERVMEAVFHSGDGPIGKTVATGDVIEHKGRRQVEAAWAELEPVNQDFLNHLFGEKGAPVYQITIPIMAMEQLAAVVVVFRHSGDLSRTDREKGALQLAAQLVSIRLSMARLAERGVSVGPSMEGPETGHILNEINNDLSAIVGRAQLLDGQSDVSGRVRYTAAEILRAAEHITQAVKNLQQGIVPPIELAGAEAADLNNRLEKLLESRHVTGNLYVFDDNRPIMLQKDFVSPSPFIPRGDNFYPFVQSVLRQFVAMLEEGDEVLVKSEVRAGYFYLSLVRGSREKHRRFDPATHDFGEPDVLPREVATDSLLLALVDNNGSVSFDRFGRRPTYLSFRFPCSDTAVAAQPAKPASAVAGLKVLAIDDQQMILDLLTGIGQSLGLELTAVRNPKDGLDLFRQGRFDLVLVDLALGRMSGWDVAREIKRMAPETPVILLTGWGIEVSPEEAARGGVDYTLAKPFRIEQLTEILARAGSRHISS